MEIRIFVRNAFPTEQSVKSKNYLRLRPGRQQGFSMSLKRYVDAYVDEISRLALLKSSSPPIQSEQGNKSYSRASAAGVDQSAERVALINSLKDHLKVAFSSPAFGLILFCMSALL